MKTLPVVMVVSKTGRKRKLMTGIYWMKKKAIIVQSTGAENNVAQKFSFQEVQLKLILSPKLTAVPKRSFHLLV